MADVQQKPAVTPERLMQFAWGYAVPLLIEAALEQKVFDRLEPGPKTADQLAAESGASPRGLRMIMNALVTMQFLAKDPQGRYTLTPESAAFLVTTKPGFQGGIFKHISTQLLPKWMKLPE